MYISVCVYKQTSDMWEVNGVDSNVLKYLAPLKCPLDVKEVLKCMQDSLYIQLTHFTSPSCTPTSVNLRNVGPIYINPFHFEFFCVVHNTEVWKGVLHVT
jgi:hypothetical protein